MLKRYRLTIYITETVNQKQSIYYQRVLRGMWLALLVAYLKEIGTDFMVARGLVVINTRIEPLTAGELSNKEKK